MCGQGTDRRAIRPVKGPVLLIIRINGLNKNMFRPRKSSVKLDFRHAFSDSIILEETATKMCVEAFPLLK